MSVTKTVHSHTAPGPLELPPIVGTAGIVRSPDLSSHPWAPTWLEAVKCFSNSGKELCQARLPGPRPPLEHPCGGFALQDLSWRDGSECCWAGPTAPCTRPGSILFKADFQSKSLKSPVWVQRAPLCAGDRAQVLRPGCWSWLDLSSSLCLRTQLAPGCR